LTRFSGSSSTVVCIKPLEQSASFLGSVAALHPHPGTASRPSTSGGTSTATRRLGAQPGGLPIDLCVHTRFERTRETAAIAPAGRRVATETEPLLDDVDVGELDGEPVDAYRTWKEAHTRRDPFPGGESLDDAARRYARAYRRLLARDERVMLLVVHEIPLRYAVNAAAGSADLDRPTHLVANAVPYLLDEASLERATARIESLVGGAQASWANDDIPRMDPWTIILMLAVSAIWLSLAGAVVHLVRVKARTP
jgi:broad specificity phosphatase PhoE